MNCYPVPRGTGEPSAGGASTEVRPHLADSWLHGESGARFYQPRENLSSFILRADRVRPLIFLLRRFQQRPRAARPLSVRGYRILLIVDYRSRCRFSQFKLRAHFLDLRRLFFQAGGNSPNFVLLLRDSRFKLSDAGLEVFTLLRDGRFLFLLLAVLFEELVEQHR